MCALYNGLHSVQDAGPHKTDSLMADVTVQIDRNKMTNKTGGKPWNTFVALQKINTSTSPGAKDNSRFSVPLGQTDMWCTHRKTRHPGTEFVFVRQGSQRPHSPNNRATGALNSPNMLSTHWARAWHQSGLHPVRAPWGWTRRMVSLGPVLAFCSAAVSWWAWGTWGEGVKRIRAIPQGR